MASPGSGVYLHVVIHFSCSSLHFQVQISLAQEHVRQRCPLWRVEEDKSDTLLPSWPVPQFPRCALGVGGECTSESRSWGSSHTAHKLQAAQSKLGEGKLAAAGGGRGLISRR